MALALCSKQRVRSRKRLVKVKERRQIGGAVLGTAGLAIASAFAAEGSQPFGRVQKMYRIVQP